MKKLKPTTQKEEVLLYLKRKGSITALEGVDKLLIIDLAGVIRDLRKEMDISDIWITKKNIYGRYIRYKRYFIEPKYRLSVFKRLGLFIERK